MCNTNLDTEAKIFSVTLRGAANHRAALKTVFVLRATRSATNIAREALLARDALRA